MRPTVVVDTNVVVSGLLTHDPRAPTAQILAGMLSGRLHFLLSVALLAEYRAVLLRPKIRERHGLSDEQVDEILGRLAANAAFRSPRREGGSPDPGDDHLLALLATTGGPISRA